MDTGAVAALGVVAGALLTKVLDFLSARQVRTIAAAEARHVVDIEAEKLRQRIAELERQVVALTDDRGRRDGASDADAK